jgi:hypothetical protein
MNFNCLKFGKIITGFKPSQPNLLPNEKINEIPNSMIEEINKRFINMQLIVKEHDQYKNINVNFVLN